MISPKKFVKELKKNNIKFYTGVPDSLFAELCNVFETKEDANHILSSNEGSSVGMAIGYNLATNKMPLVYLQNSGLGNAINPIVSLAHKKVFNVPIFFLIGWRGEVKNKKQIKDEPQHLSQGKITIDILRLLNIKYKILDSNSNYRNIINYLYKFAKKNNSMVALLIRKNTFSNKKVNTKIEKTKKLISREEAIKLIVKHIPKKIPKVSTTGMISRELYELNKKYGSTDNTLMCVGGMGHAVSIATTISKFKKRKKIICLDGDGAVLMHSGILSVSAKYKNLIHILLNNGVHDSVGGQKTPSEKIRFFKLAKEMGYSHSYKAINPAQIIAKLKSSLKKKGSVFIEIICKKGHRDNLLRPKENPSFYKKKFKNFLKKNIY